MAHAQGTRLDAHALLPSFSFATTTDDAKLELPIKAWTVLLLYRGRW